VSLRISTSMVMSMQPARPAVSARAPASRPMIFSVINWFSTVRRPAATARNLRAGPGGGKLVLPDYCRADERFLNTNGCSPSGQPPDKQRGDDDQQRGDDDQQPESHEGHPATVATPG